MPTLTVFKINAATPASKYDLGLFLAGIEGFKVLVQGGTPDETLFLRNKELVAGFMGMGMNAIGLTAADLGIGQINLENGHRISINPGPVFSLLRQEILLVFAPYSHDGAGQLVYADPDKFSLDLAIALSSFASTQLIMEESDSMGLADNRGLTEMMGLTDERVKEIEKEALENGVQKVVHTGGLARLLKNSCSNISRTSG